MTTLAWDDLERYAWLDTAMWVMDPTTCRICWANSAGLALWQAESMAELQGLDIFEVSEVSADHLLLMLNQALSTGSTRESWVIYPKGQPVRVQLAASPIELSDRRWGLCFAASKVSDQSDMYSLRGAQAVLHFSLAVVMFDLQGNVLMQNPFALCVFPQLATYAGNTFLLLSKDKKESERIWQNALEYGADQGECLFNAKPQPMWIAYNLHRVLDPVTGGPAMLLTGRDVTERILSEQKFRVLFEQSANAICLMDPIKRKVIDCNRAAAQALRLASRKQLIETDPRHFYPELQPDGVPSVEKAALLADKALKLGWQRYEWLFKRADGGELLVEVTLSPVQVGGQSLLMAVWYDLSFRRMIERQLLEAKENAESASHAKSLFLANMSHEIRTPLNAIIGMANLLSDAPLNETQRQWLDIVRFSSEGLVDLVGDILDFSRIEAGKLTLENRTFDLRALVARTVELLRVRADEKALALNLTMAIDVPRWIAGDEGRLRQALVNLIGNAVKFTSAGSVNVIVTAVPSGEQQWRLDVKVQDTGIGIAAEKLESIFDAFSQADNSITRRYGGSGLGLTISRRLIRAMGGDLTVASVMEQGSTFSFFLPVTEVDAAPADVLTSEALEPATEALRVLLVEDNSLNERLALALLGRAGHEVAVARDGREAVDTFTRGVFDLVLMDMQMPHMDGIQATQIIRTMEKEERRTPTPIVAMTANVMPEDRARCFAAGMDDFLSKPISLPKLQQVLSRFKPRTHEHKPEVHVEPANEGVAPVPATEPMSSPVQSQAVLSMHTDLFDVNAGLASCAGSMELLADLTQIFQAQWPNRREQLQLAMDNGDAPMLARHAHTLKGSFGALASARGAELAIAVDSKAKHGEIDKDDVARLLEAGDALCVLLAEWQTSRERSLDQVGLK